MVSVIAIRHCRFSVIGKVGAKRFRSLLLFFVAPLKITLTHIGKYIQYHYFLPLTKYRGVNFGRLYVVNLNDQNQSPSVGTTISSSGCRLRDRCFSFIYSTLT